MGYEVVESTVRKNYQNKGTRKGWVFYWCLPFHTEHQEKGLTDLRFLKHTIFRKRVIFSRVFLERESDLKIS